MLSLASLEGLAEAIFPVLFVGLAALSIVNRTAAIRSGTAALVTVLLIIVFPQARGLAPVIAALAVALPEAKR